MKKRNIKNFIYEKLTSEYSFILLLQSMPGIANIKKNTDFSIFSS